MKAWSTEFEHTVPLPAGGVFVTLDDARRYIARLSPQEQQTEQWTRALKELTEAATRDPKWRYFARIAVLQALHKDLPPQPRRLTKREKQEAWRERRRAWKGTSR